MFFKRLHLSMFQQIITFYLQRTYKLSNFKQSVIQARSILVDIKCNETIFYTFTVSLNICGGGCNTIADPYAQVRVLSKLKNRNMKVFNLRVNKSL